MKVRHYKLNKKSRTITPLKYILGVVFLLAVVGFSAQYFVSNYFEKSVDQGTNIDSDQQFDETPVTDEDINNYKVKPNMPRLIYVPSLGVKARIFTVGLTTKNAIGSPNNVNDAVWYNNSALPGSRGVAFIDAHTGTNQSKGIFTNINKLSRQDEVIVELGNGQKLTFYVQYSQKVTLKDVDMQKILTAKTSSPELVLMSCAGQYDKKIQTYTDRQIIYLKM